MEESSNLWKTYQEKTKGRPPSPSLVRATGFVTDKDAALDFGAGGLRDSRFLLEQGFKSVIAVDFEPTTAEIAKEIGDERLKVYTTSFDEFGFSQDAFDLINAQFSLPFITPSSFGAVFSKLMASLKPGGILVGQLFGDRDSWRVNPKMTFHTETEARKLLEGMEILEFKEEEKDEKPVVGALKHWHVFHFTTRK